MTGGPTSRESHGYLRSGSRAVVLGRGVGRGIRFLLHIVVARLLGPADFGAFVVAYSALLIVQKLVLVGIDRVGIRYGGILVARAGRAERTRFLLLLVGAAGTVGVLVGSIIVATPALWERAMSIPPSGRMVAILGLGLPLLTVSLTLAGLLRGSHRPGREAAWTEVLTPALNLGLLFLLPLVPPTGAWTPLEIVAAAFVLSYVLPTVAMGVVAARDYARPGETGEPGRILPPLAEMRGFALGVWTVGAVTVLLARADRVLVARFLSPEAVGLYSAAAILAQQNAFFVQSIAAVAAPRFALLERHGEGEELAESAGTVEEWTAVTSMPIVLLTILLAPDLLGLLGPEFRAAWLVLVILSASQAVNALTGASGAVLNMTGGERDNVRASGIGLLVMVFLVGAGAALFGLHGAAVGVAVAWAMVWIIQRVAMTNRTGPAFPAFALRRVVVPTTVAAIAGTVSLWLTSPGIPRILATAAVTLASYGAVLRTVSGPHPGARA